MSNKERSIQHRQGLTFQDVPTEKEKLTITVNLVPGGYPMLVFFLFLTLKLTGAVGWSWLWITSPFWLVGVFAILTASVLAFKKKD